MYETETFRQLLDRLRAAGQLRDITDPVDSRHIATLVDQSDKALMFHRVVGYGMPVVSGLLRSSERMALNMGVPRYADIEHKLTRAIAEPITPVYVETSATREVTYTGGDVDLFSLPVPMSSILDGGPMITAGVTIVRDGDGLNAGIYRFLLKERNLTGIDIVTPNNLRALAQRAFAEGRPLPISISIGTHPFEFMGAGYRAPMGVDEVCIAGGLRGAPVPLSMCETIDVPYIADAEIVLEAEILPTGLDVARRPFRRVHPAHGRAALEPAGAGQGSLPPREPDLLRAAHAVGGHLADDTDAVVAAAHRAQSRGRPGEGHQRHARRRRLVARRALDPQAVRREARTR